MTRRLQPTFHRSAPRTVDIEDTDRRSLTGSVLTCALDEPMFDWLTSPAPPRGGALGRSQCVSTRRTPGCA
jgi:hypothetical protein